MRRDIHNAVIPVDLTDIQDLEMIVETLQMVVKRKVPIRFGIVPIIDSPRRESQAKVVYHLWDTYGLSAVFDYLEMVSRNREYWLCKADSQVVHQRRSYCELPQRSFRIYSQRS